MSWVLAIAVVIIVVILLVAGPVSAARADHVHTLGSGLSTVIPDPPEMNDLPTVIANARNWFIGILSAVMLFFFTLGAARYIAAGPTQLVVGRLQVV